MFSKLRITRNAKVVVGLVVMSTTSAILLPKLSVYLSERVIELGAIPSKLPHKVMSVSTKGMTEHVVRLQHPGSCTGKI
jgi:hypothetical protein